MFNHSTRKKKGQYLCNNCHPADCKQSCELIRDAGSYLCVGCNAGVVVTYDKNHPGIESERVTDLDTANRMINLLRKKLDFYKRMSQGRSNEISKVKQENKTLEAALQEIDACENDKCKLCKCCIYRVSYGKPYPKPQLAVVPNEP